MFRILCQINCIIKVISIAYRYSGIATPGLARALAWQLEFLAQAKILTETM